MKCEIFLELWREKLLQTRKILNIPFDSKYIVSLRLFEISQEEVCGRCSKSWFGPCLYAQFSFYVLQNKRRIFFNSLATKIVQIFIILRLVNDIMISKTSLLHFLSEALLPAITLLQPTQKIQNPKMQDFEPFLKCCKLFQQYQKRRSVCLFIVLRMFSREI